MRLRSYLLIANGVSITMIVLFLFVSYVKMLLSIELALWLSSAAVAAGFLSFAAHFFLTRPVERSIDRMVMETQRIAETDFAGKVHPSGPLEMQMLAKSFNDMSEKLSDSFQRLRTSEALRRELVENISHDLRTPMASIQSFVEALEDEVVQDKETFERYLNTIKVETRRLAVMIEDLFQLSRLEAGRDEFIPEAAHAEDLLLESLQTHALQLEEKRIQVTADIPDSLPTVAAMPNKIKRVLSNLLQNAIRYSPTEGEITLSAAPLGEYIRICVSDQGDGIEEADQARIFERFFRQDKSRNRESGGAGLGLAIAKSIVEQHGGQIGVESRVGAGSKFWFTLPVYKRHS